MAQRITRRRFLAGSAALVASGAATGIYAWRIEPHWLEVIHRDLPVANLPSALDGCRLIQLSDLHVGPIVDSDYLIHCMQVASDLAPDMVVFTGDFMTYRWPHQGDEVERVVEYLKPPPLGRFAVLGNHDYGHRWMQPEVGEALAGRLHNLGIHVLRNEVTDVAGLQLVGIDDAWGPNFHPADALSRLDSSRPMLALCHNPDAVDEPVWSGFQGWILAGHTHGGQCKPPFLPAPMLPVRNRRYSRGEIDLFDGRRLYISAGVGYLRRVRFNCRPEMTVFTLKRA